MTSPDHITPSKALTPQTLFGLQNYNQAANAAQANMWLTQTLESFRVNLLNNLLGGFNNVGAVVSEGITAIGLALTGQPGGLDALEAWANKLPFIGDIVEALTMKEDGDLNDLVSWALGALGRDSSLAGRVSKIEGKIAEGADFFDDFNRGDADTLGPNWRQFGTGTKLGVYDQAAQIKRLSIGLDIGRQHAITEQVLSSDDFTIQAVIHPAGTSAFVAMQLYARMNADCTEGLSLNLFGGKCYLARMTRNASNNNQTMVDLGDNQGKSYSNSATVTFQGKADHLWVYIDSNLVIEIQPGANVGPIDAAHRRGGFSEATAFGLPAQYSGAPASFSMRSSVEVQAVQVATAVAVAAQETATDVKSQVAQLIAKDQAETSQGFNGHETFDRDNSPTLGGGWTQVQSGTGYAGAFGIVDGAAAYTTVSGQGGNTNVVAVGPGSFMSDSQSLLAVIKDAGVGSSYTRWWVRSNGDASNPVGVYVQKGEGFFSLVSRAASGTETQLDRNNITARDGDSIEIRAGDSGAIIVKRNNTTILTGTDAGTVPKGAGYRRYMLSVHVFDAYYNQYRPASTNSIDVSDFAPPAVRGTTWRAQRLGTTGTPISSGNQRFAAGTFGTVYCSQSVTLDDSGAATVPTEGVYMIKFRVQIAASNNGYYWRPILWRMDAGTSTWVIDQFGTDVISPDSNENQNSCGDTFQVYLRAGDKVAVGMRQAGSTSIVGTASGANTYWTGTLVAA